MNQQQWLGKILQKNQQFRHRVSPDTLPTERTPGALVVITCMDPRVNLEAIGIPGFASDGSGGSPVRIIRTIGAMAEPRSLVIGMFLAGIREFVVLMHTDCGCSLAHSKLDVIVENVEKRLSSAKLQAFKAMIGEPFDRQLADWLKVFAEPRQAVQDEVASIRSLSYLPDDVIVHGLLYDLASGGVEVVVNGYA